MGGCTLLGGGKGAALTKRSVVCELLVSFLPWSGWVDHCYFVVCVLFSVAGKGWLAKAGKFKAGYYIVEAIWKAIIIILH